MTSADFCVGAFEAGLGEVEFELRHGKGFAVISVLPVHRWTSIETLIAYWSIASHLGVPLPNNANGNVIGHVVDLGGRLYARERPRIRHQRKAELP